MLQLARQNLAAAVVLRHLPLLADPTGLPRTDLCVNMTAGEEGAEGSDWILSEEMPATVASLSCRAASPVPWKEQVWRSPC